MTGPAVEAVIDLDAYRHNLEVLRRTAPDAHLMGVVKADGYGHGATVCARTARDAGVEWLGVATLDEALALRAAGDTGRLLTWLAPYGADFAAAIDRDVDVTASSVDQLEQILAAPSRGRARVHLKADTGMSRNGALGAEWAALCDAASRAHRGRRLEVVGIFSHLACADEPDHPSVAAQEQCFADACTQLGDAGVNPSLCHLANSAATLTRPTTHLDMVRVGIASYGLTPAPAVGSSTDLGLRPVMTLRARLSLVKRVPAGSGVSYGHTYVTDQETTLGLVPVGYGDGLLRSLSNRAQVWARDRRWPIAGRMCMDQFMVDLGGSDVRAGETVTLFGPGDAGEPTAQEWAETAGTISYEVVTRLGGRVQRTYVDEDQGVGTRREHR